jgi:hypothetical protein
MTECTGTWCQADYFFGTLHYFPPAWPVVFPPAGAVFFSPPVGLEGRVVAGVPPRASFIAFAFFPIYKVGVPGPEAKGLTHTIYQILTCHASGKWLDICTHGNGPLF